MVSVNHLNLDKQKADESQYSSVVSQLPEGFLLLTQREVAILTKPTYNKVSYAEKTNAL